MSDEISDDHAQEVWETICKLSDKERKRVLFSIILRDIMYIGELEETINEFRTLNVSEIINSLSEEFRKKNKIKNK